MRVGMVTMERHAIQRIRREPQRRVLEVRRMEAVTPLMRRVVLGGPALAGFDSPAPDDHIKLFLPTPGGMERRDYTPRAHDGAAGELAVDFALHEAGPATTWALSARPGDTLEIAGPRGSLLVPNDFDWWLLLGDETALPAIGRRVEALPHGTQVTTLATVTGPAEEQRWTTPANLVARWAHRPAARADDPAPLLHALEGFVPPPGDGFVWVAAEATVARALRAHVRDRMAHPPEWTKASGYWIKGVADGHDKLES